MSAGDGLASLHSAFQVSLLLGRRFVNLLASSSPSLVVSLPSNLVGGERAPLESSQVFGVKLAKEAKRDEEARRTERHRARQLHTTELGGRLEYYQSRRRSKAPP